MSALDLTQETINEVIATLKADFSVYKKWKATADRLLDEGVDANTLENDVDYRKTFRTEVILLSFTQHEQALFNKPITALSDEQKVTRRWVQQQIGTRLNKVLKYVKIAETERTMTDEQRGAQQRATMESRLKRDLTAWIAKVEKSEASTFDATEMLKHLRAASALIKQ